MEIEKTNKKYISFSQKHKIALSTLYYLCQSLGLKTCISMRDNKVNIFETITVKNQSDEKVHKIKNLGKINDYVYDIETETHDFDCGFPLIVHKTDTFVLSVSTIDVIEDLNNLEDIFDFSNLDKNHELFFNKNKKLFGKFQIETPKNFWIDEFVCRRSKMYAFKCGNDSGKTN